MATIENFATVNYTSNGVTATKVSNLAEIELGSSVSLSKTAVTNAYKAGTPITYVISITNSSASAISNITVTDDLGTFTESTLELTPLTFSAPAMLLINGADSTAQLSTDSTTQRSVVFTIPSLAAGATANIIYNAVPNEYAPLASQSSITNTATLTSDSACAEATAAAAVTVAEAADVEVIKSMSPNPVICGGTVTYTIRIYNYGNAPAENVVLTDAFTPAPTNVTVSRNGTALTADAYTYTDGTLTVPVASDTVPAATVTRSAATGEVSVSPGVVEYVITGTV